MDESQYNVLRKATFKLAYSIVKNKEIAEDATHNALLKLILQEKEIKNKLGWLLKVVKNECNQLFRDKRKEQTQLNNLNSLVCYDKIMNENAQYSTQISVKKYVSKEEYRLFKQWKKCKGDLKALAKLRSTTVNYVNKEMTIFRKNLKSAILREKGFLNQDILNYHQYTNIQLFTKNLKKYLLKNEAHRMKRYLEEFEGEFPKLDIAEIKKYTITLLKDKFFRLSVFYMTHEKQKKVCQFKVKFYTNRLKIVEIVETILMVKLSEKQKEILENKLPSKTLGICKTTFKELKNEDVTIL